MVLSFLTDRPLQTVQTQIRLLLEEHLEEQSDQSLHCLSFCLHLLDKFLTENILDHFGCPKINLGLLQYEQSLTSVSGKQPYRSVVRALVF